MDFKYSYRNQKKIGYALEGYIYHYVLLLMMVMEIWYRCCKHIHKSKATHLINFASTFIPQHVVSTVIWIYFRWFHNRKWIFSPFLTPFFQPRHDHRGCRGHLWASTVPERVERDVRRVRSQGWHKVALQLLECLLVLLSLLLQGRLLVLLILPLQPSDGHLDGVVGEVGLHHLLLCHFPVKGNRRSDWVRIWGWNKTTFELNKNVSKNWPFLIQTFNNLYLRSLHCFENVWFE